jgi:uncharacterized membrane protein YoaK (UPF0700 family)
MTKFSVPSCMSANAGYVDTAGFLALQGLFTAHVTGNFVTLGASLVLGSSGAVAKLLALPVFCAVIIVSRLLAHRLPGIGLPILRTMLTVQCILLALGAVLAINLGTGRHGDEWPVILTGMVLVSAMAIQNAASRIHLASAPPTTLMTGTTTQIMIDIADLLRGLAPEAEAAARARLSKMVPNVVGFALGCGAGAILFSRFGMWCFVVPPILAVVPVMMNATKEQV